MRFEKHRITNFHISFSSEAFQVQLFKEENKGSTLYHFEDNRYEIVWVSSDHNEDQITSFINKIDSNIENNFKDVYNALGGVFQIFIYNKNKYKLLVLSDLYGVNGSFCLSGCNKLKFFNNFRNFNELGIKLEFNSIGVQAHFAFGYQVKPFPLPYKNMKRLEGGKYYTFDKELAVSETILECVKTEADGISEVKQSLNSKDNIFLGATAGKDSLALLSLLENHESVLSGNFGNPKAADVLQGEAIVNTLKIPYVHENICDANEFEQYAHQIATTTGGLGTVSYVDMLKFVDQTIPENYKYVMGEAGECVRMFFPENEDLTKALHNYLTPKEFLKDSFTVDFDSFLDQYPKNITDEITKTYHGTTNAEILVNFYRKGRLPGNFGNRHKLLTAYRDKITPFLNENFIKGTHHLPLERYRNNAIHRSFITKENKELIPFFDHPIQSETSVQDWNHRFKNEIGVTVYQLLEKYIHALEDIFDAQKVLALAKKQQKTPNRGLYFLCRIVSMAIFADSIKNAPCEKK